MYDSKKWYAYRASAFAERVGLQNYEDATQEHVDQFRATATDLSPVTIEGYIKAVGFLTGKKFNGKKLKKRFSKPKSSIPLADLSKVYAAARADGHEWMMNFLRWGYITGFRHHDLTRLNRSSISDTMIEHEASKTGWLHRIPRHFILHDDLPAEDFPLYRNEKTVRFTIKRYTDRAGVPYFTPQRLRVTSINQYERAYPGAAAVIQGIALGSTLFRSYVDQFEFLKSAQEGLQIPDSMLPASKIIRREMEEKRLISAFRTLPVDERTAVLSLISRGK